MPRSLLLAPTIVTVVALATAGTLLAAGLMPQRESAPVAGSRSLIAPPASPRAVLPATDLAQSVKARDLIVMMTLSPGRAGDNELTIMYLDADGDERSTEDVRVRLSYLDYGDQSLAWPPTESHPGHIRLLGSVPHEGNWRIEVEIWRSGMGATQASFEVNIGQ